jgi:hypothetical protein
MSFSIVNLQFSSIFGFASVVARAGYAPGRLLFS